MTAGVALDLTHVATEWLDGLETAFNAHRADSVVSLFRSDGSWRDVLALTGQIVTSNDPTRVEAVLAQAWTQGERRNLHINRVWGAVQGERYGEEVIEAFFSFTTQVGGGQGIVRLRPSEQDSDRVMAWILSTALRTLTDPNPAERLDRNEPAVDAARRNWLDRRLDRARYADRDPAVLIVGAGQQGLAVAARLKALGVDTLVLERSARVGDNWRNRYHALRLHNDTRANHLPFLPFPATWGPYTPKDQLGNWFEFYADALELNVWSDTEFVGADHDAATNRWTVEVERDGAKRTLRPRHIVVATGVSGAPSVPQLTGLDRFAGSVLHSTAYTEGRDFAGKRVLVVGCGVSGHDVCQDLDRHEAAEITMMQRSPTMVISVEPGCKQIFSLYTKEDRPTEESDLLNISATFAVQKKWLPVYFRKIAELDKELLDGLHAAGFETNLGQDDLGFSFEYRRRGGGYYMDVGCSQLIIDGRVKILQARDVATFTERGVALIDGVEREYDAVVLATGFTSISDDVRRLFGPEIADRVGPVWGIDDDGEIRNVARRTAQDGLWFMAGGFPEARIYSHYLALQIAAHEAGVSL